MTSKNDPIILNSDEGSNHLEYSNDGKSAVGKKRQSVFPELTEKNSMKNTPYSDKNIPDLIETKMNFLN